MSDEERRDKEKAAFDEALSGYWEGAAFNGCDVVSTKLLCGDDELKWNDQDAIKEYFKVPVRDVHKYSELSDKCKSMFNHLDCHLNEIVFVRCQDLTCCGEWRSGSVKVSLAKNEYRLPAPDMSKYETYLHSLSESSFGFDYSFQPSVKMASLGKCEICPSFYFKSKTGKVRHVVMFHRRQKRTHPKKISCDTCGQIFSSMSCLNRYKKSAKHDTRSLSKETKKAKRRKTKQRTLNKALRQVESENSAIECIISKLENVVIEWVSCESCRKWYHSKWVPTLI